MKLSLEDEGKPATQNAKWDTSQKHVQNLWEEKGLAFSGNEKEVNVAKAK